MIGQTVSHYKILEKLGEGGMGVVYKAEDTRLQRTVALKFLSHGLESHEPERARLLQEARAASALNHPNVCTIYDIGEADGQQFIVMEYVDGVTLRERIAPGKLPIGTAVGYAIQIGEALKEAHGKGIVHRDIKAENIIVNSKNHVKVMDFGLAKLKGSLRLTKASSHRKSGMAGARRLTSGTSYATVPLGSRDFYYVPPGTTELHRISLPDGNDHAVKMFPGFGIHFSISTVTGEIAYTESYRRVRFVLIENVFR